eukprot:6354173-Prymnesium_polylepis.1
MDAEIEGETAAVKRRKAGATLWATTMIALSDIEMHVLMAIGEGRANSQDPRASMHAKQEEIRKAQHEKAERVASAAAEAKAKKDEIEARAKEMQEKAAEAWQQRAVQQHAALENDDAKVYGQAKTMQVRTKRSRRDAPR